MKLLHNNSSPRSVVVWGILALVVFVGAYLGLVFVWKADHFRIFDLVKNFSWAERAQGLSRIEVNPDIDNYILSKDSWKKFRLSFTLVNPRRPGLIFHFQNPKNHGFIYIQEDTGNVILGVLKDGVSEVLQGISRLRFSQEDPCLLDVDGNRIKFYVGNKLAGSITIPWSKGQFGFLITEKSSPPTVFRDLRVEGQLSLGPRISAQSPPAFSRASPREQLFLFLFFLALLGLSLYFYFFLSYLAANRLAFTAFFAKVPLNTATAGLVHFFLAAWIFWPFFLKGQIFVSSYDNFGEIYPLFFFSKHQFAQWVGGQGFPLWNPYFHDGTPFYSSHWNFIYYPLNWPIFFLPDEWVFFALTLKTFLELFLTGWLAYKFFELEVRGRCWALLGAIVYQLCSFVLFAFTLFPTMSLYFAMTLYLYLVWSLARRGPRLNFVLLSLAVYLILTSANVAFVFFAVLSLAVIAWYRWSSTSGSRGSCGGLLIVSGFTGFLLSAVRWLPCLWSIAASNRVVENYQTIHDRIFLVTRLFLPEIAGWMGPNSLNALTSDNLRLIFRGMDLPSNPQNAFFAYFGIIAALAILLSLLLSGHKKFRFWKIYTMTALAICLLAQPFWGILCILFFPFQHFSYHLIILPVGVAALTAWIGQRLFTENVLLPGTVLRRFFALATWSQLYILIFVTYLFPLLTNFARAVLGVVALGWIVWGHVNRRFPHALHRYYAVVGGLLLGLMWFMVLTVTVSLIVKPFFEKGNFFLFFVLPGIQVLAALCLAFWMRICSLEKLLTPLMRKGSLLYGGLMIIAATLWAGSVMLDYVMRIPEMYRLYGIDIFLGELKFFVIFFVLVSVVVLYRRDQVPTRWAGLMLIVVVIFDLLVFQERFNNISSPISHRNPFYGRGYSYATASASVRNEMNLVDYRVSGLFQTDLNANKGIIFSWPSYTGTLGYLSRRYATFITNFGFPPGAIMIYPEDEHFTNKRFLTLSAVRYIFRGPTFYWDHAITLSRLNLFYDFEVGPDDDTILKRLSDETFDPLGKVLLAPGTTWSANPQPGRPSEQILITKTRGNEIGTRVRADAPAVVLFVESYDEGWKAFVNGRPTPIRPANYNFMAFEIGSGPQDIRLIYDPPKFRIALAISALGVLCFVFILIFGRTLFRQQVPEE